MGSEVYKVAEIVGSSPNRASASLRNLRWFEVAQMRDIRGRQDRSFSGDAQDRFYTDA